MQLISLPRKEISDHFPIHKLETKLKINKKNTFKNFLTYFDFVLVNVWFTFAAQKIEKFPWKISLA